MPQCSRHIEKLIQEEDELVGVAIDAPLIINNDFGQRQCEKSLSSAYSRRKVSCHSSNLNRYPNSASVRLSIYLEENGFKHLQNASDGRFQIECYPHPAIIEIFELTERLKYKKGSVSIKRQGQMNLSRYILALRESPVISLSIDENLLKYLNEQYIESLAGADLKTNEDVLDSIICLYVSALFVSSASHHIYGSKESGYIYVPETKCLIKAITSNPLAITAEIRKNTAI